MPPWATVPTTLDGAFPSTTTRSQAMATVRGNAATQTIRMKASLRFLLVQYPVIEAAP